MITCKQHYPPSFFNLSIIGDWEDERADAIAEAKNAGYENWKIKQIANGQFLLQACKLESPTSARLDLTKMHEMYGASVKHTLDELVEHLIVEYDDELPRQKRMSRYQTLHRMLNTFHSAIGTTEFGSPGFAPEMWYVILQAMERAGKLNDALVKKDGG